VGGIVSRFPLPASPIRNAWGRSFSFLFILSLVAFVVQICAEEPPVYGRVSDFSFTERSGKQLSRSDLEGTAWIANFIFTRCQGMCPMLSGRMAELQKKFAATEIKLVSFSVDPEFDTPEVLTRYAARFGAAEGEWFFLTGDKTAMREFISAGFHLGAEDATPEDLAQGAEPVMHSNRFVLVDQAGNIRGLYDSSEPAKMEELVRDAAELSKNQ
jgi:protein SCO1/2